MPWYRTQGKILEPITDTEFKYGMEHGKYVQPNHQAFNVLLYYSAVRKQEALRAQREQFQISRSNVNFNVGKRLKHGVETPPLPLPLKLPYMTVLVEAVEQTRPGERVFPYSLKTGYNIVHRAFKYPHLFRLSRITNFFNDGWTIAQVRSWTGLTLAALDYYIGVVDIQKMSRKLK